MSSVSFPYRVTKLGRRNLVNAATEEDPVHRAFTVEAPDRLWVSDITGHL
ncbi:hypothetical protein ACFQX6_17135 [Streptosporangium lutulentum]